MSYKIKLPPFAKIFYHEWLLHPKSPRYNLVVDQTLYGQLDVYRLRSALKRYVAEHLLLNSHVTNHHDEPYWVKNNVTHELKYSENSPIDKNELLSYVKDPFDLYQGPLYRFQLFRLSKNIYRLIIVYHHLVIDGLSMEKGIFEIISNYYNNPYHIAKYSLDKQIQLITDLEQSLSEQLEKNSDQCTVFWQKKLATIENVDLRFLNSNNHQIRKNTLKKQTIVDEIRFSYGETELAKLQTTKKRYGVSPYIYGQCVFAMLLHRHTQQKYFAISYPISIQQGQDFIYGAQVNMNIMPYHFDKDTTMIDLFKQAQTFSELTRWGNIKHSYYPITNIMHAHDNKDLLNVAYAQTNFRYQPLDFAGISKVEISSELNVDGITKSTLLFEQEPLKDTLNYRL